MTADDKLREFQTHLGQSLQDQSFIKLTLGHYTGEEADLKSIQVRRIVIKREEKLSFTYRYKTRDIVKNYGAEEAVARIADSLRFGFHAATLFTTAFDLVFDDNKGKQTLKQNPATQAAPATLDHDRAKTRLVAAKGQSWLHDLKITDDKGAVLKASQDKYRQINKYVEILDGLIKSLPEKPGMKIVDMGSGKGYLTFALYDHLTNTLKRDVAVEGVEFRPDMVALCNDIAKKSDFPGLRFVEGTIENYDSKGADILIALHACDTATDDAIAKGITAGAELIVVAPCCHKQIRREIEKSRRHNDLGFLMEHGIFIERQAEMVTDGLRALILEYFGYSTKVFEFISDVHTPKNAMIVGVRNAKAALKDPKILAKINDAKNYFGIVRHHLEDKTGL
ncbi:MAG: SAM-dependent methyltransferase [Micavibrio sp.]|nr:SAM-dependent methyltransferase [Micavibrio sp.]